MAVKPRRVYSGTVPAPPPRLDPNGRKMPSGRLAADWGRARSTARRSPMGLFGKSDKEKEAEAQAAHHEAQRKMQEALRRREQAAAAKPAAAPAAPAAGPAAAAPAAAKPQAVPVSQPAA